jgi:ATP-dependent Lhr-like helicase
MTVSSRHSDTLWLAGVCAARIGSSGPYQAYAAVLPLLQSEWGMSATAAGSVSSAFQIGFAVSLVVLSALARLEGEGVVLRGKFRVAAEDEEWCDRRLLARIHRYTLARLRKEIEPVSAAEYIRFLFAWQGITGDDPGGEAPPASGPEAVATVLARLEGYEAPAAAWP